MLIFNNKGNFSSRCILNPIKLIFSSVYYKVLNDLKFKHIYYSIHDKINKYLTMFL